MCDGAGKVASASGGARGKVAADNSNQPSDRSVVMDGSGVGEVPAVSGGGRREVAADNNSNQPSNRSVGRLGENVGRARGSNVCTFCLGVCCSLMRDLINMLVEFGEVKPNQKVCLVFINEVLNLMFRAIRTLFSSFT